jgi:hypothetical protein
MHRTILGRYNQSRNFIVRRRTQEIPPQIFWRPKAYNRFQKIQQFFSFTCAIWYSPNIYTIFYVQVILVSTASYSKRLLFFQVSEPTFKGYSYICHECNINCLSSSLILSSHSYSATNTNHAVSLYTVFASLLLLHHY